MEEKTPPYIIGTSRTSGAGNLFVAHSDYEGNIEKWNNMFEIPFPKSFIYIKDGWYSSLHHAEDINKAVSLISKNTNSYVNKLLTLFEEEQISFNEDIEKINTLTNFKEFHNLYVKLFKHYAIYIPLSRFVEIAITNLLKDKYPRISESEIFELSKFYGEHEGIQKKFKDAINEVATWSRKKDIEQIGDIPFYDGILKDLLKKYGWIKSYLDFRGSLSKGEICRMINNKIKNPQTLRVDAINKDKKGGLLLKQGIKEEDKIYFQFLADMAKIKTIVQDSQAKLSFFGKPNYEKIAESLDITLEELKWLSFDEISHLIEIELDMCPDNMIKTYKRLILHRKKGLLIIHSGKKAIYETNHEAIEDILEAEGVILRDLLKEDIDFNSNKKIIGTPAFEGEITGKVVVVLSTDDHKKIKNFEGNNIILVGHEITPDYTPLLEQVNGIISDTGGITSHTAIIARELSKPCIVGSEVATKLLKDGDRVLMKKDGEIVRLSSTH